tara:strand:+ start:1829 stop:2914 length:1086 start_codon:yes stop_codon:yes gene_type:complete
MKSIRSWELSNIELNNVFKENHSILSLKVRGNTWEPISRWYKLDSRLFKKTTNKARITLPVLESLAEIYDYKVVTWRAIKLSPLNTNLLPISIKSAIRKLPLLKSIAFEIELILYKQKIISEDKSISIVIPARNEEGNRNLIKNAITKISELEIDTEIILVEGNSKDKTFNMLEELKTEYKDLNIKLIKQSGKGKKNAVSEGFNIAKGNTLAIIDSDLTVDIQDSIDAIRIAANSSNVLINCSRTIFPMEENAMRWANYIGNRCFAILLSSVTNQKISDSLCGTKVFSRELFNQMKVNGSWDSKADPFGDFTIIFEAAKHNNRILNYPVKYYARQAGSPNISRWIDGLKLLKVTFLYIFSK